MVFPPLCMPALFHDALAKHLGSQPPELFMNMPIGRQVFINSEAMFTDLGGISLEERVLIGPHATIISVNHPLDPAERRGATILLGTPNWLNTLAPPVAAFLAANDFSGKTIAAFCTHGGGGLGRITGDVRKLGTGATVLSSLELYGRDAADAGRKIDAWLSANGLNRK